MMRMYSNPCRYFHLCEHFIILFIFKAPYEGNFTDICTILYCFDNDGQNCNSYLGGDGIPCGDKKVRKQLFELSKLNECLKTGQILHFKKEMQTNEK